MVEECVPFDCSITTGIVYLRAEVEGHARTNSSEAASQSSKFLNLIGAFHTDRSMPLQILVNRDVNITPEEEQKADKSHQEW